MPRDGSKYSARWAGRSCARECNGCVCATLPALRGQGRPPPQAVPRRPHCAQRWGAGRVFLTLGAPEHTATASLAAAALQTQGRRGAHGRGQRAAREECPVHGSRNHKRLRRGGETPLPALRAPGGGRWLPSARQLCVPSPRLSSLVTRGKEIQPLGLAHRLENAAFQGLFFRVPQKQSRPAPKELSSETPPHLCLALSN